MTKEEIIAANKVIAIFMGAVEVKDDYDEWCLKSYTFPAWNKYQSFEALKYHKEWNWLIPVVQKIDSIPVKNLDPEIILKGNVYATLKMLDIDLLWLAAVKFINWYKTKSPC